MVVEGQIEIIQEEPKTHEECKAASQTTVQQNREEKEEMGQNTSKDQGSEKGEALQSSKKGKREEKEEISNTSKRKKCGAWAHFDLLPRDSHPDKQLRAKCKYCPAKIKCDPKEQGTSGLNKHMQRCTQNPNHLFKQDECRKSVAMWVVLDEMPFRAVEGEGFKRMMNQIEPRFEIPSRSTVTRDCLRLHMEESINLKRYFKRTKVRVSLTTDTWTSCQNANYMCLTAHWIDEDWTYQKRILNFCVVENHKGETIATKIENCLASWNIDKVFTITVDDASSNDTIIAKLKVVLKQWKGLVCDGDFLHLRCWAHILNMVVSDGLKDLRESIEGIRNAIKYVRSSPSRLQKFTNLVEGMKYESKAQLALDCPTKWNSIYIMLESAVKFSNAFERMRTDDENYIAYFMDKNLIGPPSELDFDNAEKFMVFLEFFYQVSLEMSGSTCVTSNIYLQNIADIFITLKENATDPNSIATNMAQSMQVNFDKYWGNFENLNPLLAIAAILDPRSKVKLLKVAFKEILVDDAKCDDMLQKMLNVLHRLYDHYASILSASQENTQASGSTNAIATSIISSGSSSTPNQSRHRLRSKLLLSLYKKDSETANVQEDKYGEIHKYLDSEVLERKEEDFDILTWWKQNGCQFKVLSLIARDVLAMSISTVSSESAFSIGGHVISEYRSSLSPKTVEALICTQNWLSPSRLCKKLQELYIDNYNDTHGEEQQAEALLRDLEKSLDK